jgi:oligosaccharide repeat unit polymerase
VNTVIVESAQPSGTQAARPTRTAGLWWLSPPGALFVVALPTLAYAATLDDAAYRAAWGVGKALTTDLVLVILAGLLVFMLGSSVPLLRRHVAPSRPWPALSERDVSVLRSAAPWLFWGTLAGYVLLLAAGASRGATPAAVLQLVASGNLNTDALKDSFAPIAGLTSFTQLGLASVTVSSLLLVSGRSKRAVVQLLVVVLVSVPRGFLLSERLAVIELLVPVAVVFALAGVTRGRPAVRRMWRLAPVILIPLVLVLFAAFEFVRSWSFYATRTSQSFADWALQRFLGYYATSYNNGALSMLYEPEPGRLPNDSLGSFWSAPGIAQAHLYERLSSPGSATRFDEVLVQHGNPEFNNPCGICQPFTDFGTIGGLVWLLVAGLVLGALYVGFVAARPIQLLVYPMLVTGLFELPRYLYWTSGRIVPATLALVVIGYLMRRRRRADEVLA